MARSASAIQADIDALDARRLAILNGSSVDEYSVGAQSYKFAKLTLPELSTLRAELLDELDEANGTSGAIVIPRYNGGV